MMEILGYSSVVKCLNKLTSSNIAQNVGHRTEKDQFTAINGIRGKLRQNGDILIFISYTSHTDLNLVYKILGLIIVCNKNTTMFKVLKKAYGNLYNLQNIVNLCILFIEFWNEYKSGF